MTCCAAMPIAWPRLDIWCTPPICSVWVRGCDALSAPSGRSRRGRASRSSSSSPVVSNYKLTLTVRAGLVSSAFAWVVASRCCLSAEGYHAASVNYGMVPSDIDELAARAGPIVASYGGRDWTIKGVPALREALRTHDVPHDVEVYPAAGHCFLNDKPNGPLLFRPVAKLAHAGPEPASAADAWRRIEAFFADHLGSRTAQ
jgi:carboxymethylenebutenolidase